MRRSPLLPCLGILFACGFLVVACHDDDPGRSFLSAGAPEPVGDPRTTQRGSAPSNDGARRDPRAEKKAPQGPADRARDLADAGPPRAPVDQRPFDIGRPPVLDGGTVDPRSLDAGPGER
jgi:hypothetical protein